jgi:hypothetical protein
MPRQAGAYLKPRLTWAQLQAQMERKRMMQEFDSFCVVQEMRVGRMVDDMARRIALGPQLEPTEMDSGAVHYEGRK